VTSFRFPLEKVLQWRRTQLELEEAGFRHQTAALASLDRTLAELEADGIRAEMETRKQRMVSACDLAALGTYRISVREREAAIGRNREECRKVLDARQASMMEARRRFRLLERLKLRRLEEWQKARDHELDEIASESFLARWTREQ
jgi:flagellar export protein FliJ